MKFFFALCFCLPFSLAAQSLMPDSIPVSADTTVYNFVDEPPRFPTPCEFYDTTATAKKECSDVALLRYVNQRAGYPAEAREGNISGLAVIGFLVESNGIISRAEVLRDPGGGLGMAALRAVAEMAQNVRWRPAVKDGEHVRFFYTLPIRFRLEEPKPYVVVDRDTVYIEFDKALAFTGEGGKLGNYFNDNLSYPASGEDSCRLGELDLQLLVGPDGRVKVQDIIDFNDLGTDFTFEAISVANRSTGMWEPAEYQGRPVTAAYNITINFVPESPACTATVEEYNAARIQVAEGQALLQDTNTIALGLEKLDLALERFPRDGRFLLARGQARMDNNLLAGACRDLRLAKDITLVDWYDSFLPLLCQRTEE